MIEKASEDNFRKHFEKLSWCGITLQGPSTISGIALESVNGGVLDGVTISNIQMKDVHTAIFLRLGKRDGSPKMSELRNVVISDIKATCVSKVASSIVGVPGGIIDNVLIKNVEITLPGGGTINDANANVPEAINGYPESNMFGTPLPAYGFYVRHANNVKFENVSFKLNGADARPDYVFDDVTGGEITGISPVIDENDFHITLEDGSLNIQSKIGGYIGVDVIDISGRIVHSATQDGTSINSPVTIGLPERGIFIVSIRTDKGSFVRKVINL